MSRAPILDPKWPYIPAAAHGDSAPFRERQRLRMLAAQGKPQPTNVKPITQRKSK